jgi:hypothetical protein
VHGQHPIDQIYGGGAFEAVFVLGGVGADVMGYIGNVYAYFDVSVFEILD